MILYNFFDMKFNFRPLVTYTIASAFLVGCGSTTPAIISTPTENIDTSPLKEAELTKAEKENWGHLDLERDTIPGMGVDRAYAEIIKGRKGKKTIVAIIDSGIDIDHEDLDDVIWANKDEIPNNGKDDDNNGYIDDVHGWNFLGDTYDEQLEYTRLIKSGNTADPRFNEAKELLESEKQQALQTKQNVDGLFGQIKPAQDVLKQHFGNDN
ncbi:MAG: peptidase S8, partial [Psychroserpens sp.]|nr:peptidase S8 [Psychroserpens sp.]